MVLVVSFTRAIPYSGKHYGLVGASCSFISPAFTGPDGGLPLPAHEGLLVTVIGDRECHI
jgi:hypothetical protein